MLEFGPKWVRLDLSRPYHTTLFKELVYRFNSYHTIFLKELFDLHPINLVNCYFSPLNLNITILVR